jgi:pyridoxal phosphate enzyme (YggS family)
MERTGPYAENLRLRIASVRDRVAAACVDAARLPETVELVAITKTVPANVVRVAMEAGLNVFGENRVQDAEGKIDAVRDGTWHLVGHLQRNKARLATQHFACIQSLDSVRLAHRLEDVRDERHIDVLVQVNLLGTQTQHGAAIEDVGALCDVINRETGLTLRGLMTIGPLGENSQALRSCFRELREMRDTIRLRLPNQPFNELSMGMTDDFELAIAEGSTMVRVGRAIFGDRSLTAASNQRQGPLTSNA